VTVPNVSKDQIDCDNVAVRIEEISEESGEEFALDMMCRIQQLGTHGIAKIDGQTVLPIDEVDLAHELIAQAAWLEANLRAVMSAIPVDLRPLVTEFAYQWAVRHDRPEDHHPDCPNHDPVAARQNDIGSPHLSDELKAGLASSRHKTIPKA
jgi:hypothetical protein